MQSHPRRVSGIEVEEVDDGFMVHQPDRDKIHYLNHTAVLVLELCTGTNSAERIAELLAEAYGLPSPPAREVAEVLEKLRDESLVE